jgi:hypothetical protein
MKSLAALGVTGLAGIVGLTMGATPVQADAISDFYKNTRITIVVGSTSGGGYDTYARTLARHLGRNIPGNPGTIVQNRPGAGGIVATNFISNVAKQDGSYIGAVQRTVPFDQIMGFKGPQFDPVKMHWLGSVTNEAGVIVVTKKAKVHKLEDVFTTPVIAGSTGPSDSEIYPALLNNVMGAKFKLILGYPGSSQIHLAMQRGEIEGYSQSWSSFKIQAGPTMKENYVPLVQISLKPLDEMTKMGVPMIMDFVNREHVRPEYSVEDAKTWWRQKAAPRRQCHHRRGSPANDRDPGERAQADFGEGQRPDQVQGRDQEGHDQDGEAYRQGHGDQAWRPPDLHQLQGQGRAGQGIGFAHQGHGQWQKGQA